MANIFQKLSGIIGSAFQIGIGGPKVKSNSGNIEARNAADDAYTALRTNGYYLGASGPYLKNSSGSLAVRDSADAAFAPLNAGTPTTWGDNALVTAGMLQKSFIVGAEFAGASAPSNTGTVRFLLCTTTGGAYTAGDLAFDNGTSTGTVTRIPATDGMVVSVTAPLNTGILTVDPGVQVWLSGSFTPLLTGSSGFAQSIMVEFSDADFGGGTLSSTATIPANAVILNTRLQVFNAAAFDAGTVAVGHSSTAALLQATTDNDLTTAGLNIVEGTTTNAAWGASALAVQLTFTGSPTTGQGRVVVTYVEPNT